MTMAEMARWCEKEESRRRVRTIFQELLVKREKRSANLGSFDQTFIDSAAMRLKK